MNDYIKDLIFNFEGNNYSDFLAYVYLILENIILSSKKKSDRDKYIKIRQNILEYIVAHKSVIVTELRKKKNN